MNVSDNSLFILIYQGDINVIYDGYMDGFIKQICRSATCGINVINDLSSDSRIRNNYAFKTY